MAHTDGSGDGDDDWRGRVRSWQRTRTRATRCRPTRWWRPTGRERSASYGPHLLAEVKVSGGRDGRDPGRVPRAGWLHLRRQRHRREDRHDRARCPDSQSGDNWTVSFMMPARYTKDTLPAPRTDAIRFVEAAASRQVVDRFTGLPGTDDLADPGKGLAGLGRGSGPDHHRRSALLLLRRADDPALEPAERSGLHHPLIPFAGRSDLPSTRLHLDPAMHDPRHLPTQLPRLARPAATITPCIGAESGVGARPSVEIAPFGASLAPWPGAGAPCPRAHWRTLSCRIPILPPACRSARARSPPHAAAARGISAAVLALVLKSVDDDKAEDIVQIDLRGRSDVADYMVICSGRSSRQVASISEKLADRLKQEMRISVRMEGKDTGDWVLIDAGDVIVHVFRPEVREFYQLEKMWLPGAIHRGPGLMRLHLCAVGRLRAGPERDLVDDYLQRLRPHRAAPWPWPGDRARGRGQARRRHGGRG